MAECLRQFKGILYWGEPSNRRNTLEGKMMDGWVPSLILLAMAENSTAGYDKGYFLKALSVAQFRPAAGASTYGKEVFCWPLLQIYQHEENGSHYWFGRLHP